MSESAASTRLKELGSSKPSYQTLENTNFEMGEQDGENERNGNTVDFEGFSQNAKL